MEFLIILVFGFALMWVLIVLPQRRRQAAHAAMVGEIETGDEILTTGGLYGTVRRVGDDELGVEVAPGVEVRVAKRAVAAVVPPADEGDATEYAADGATEDSTGAERR